MPVPIILDTDIDTDCDDVGAMAVLHALADKQEAQILGVVCDAPTPWGACCIQAINAYYGRPEIPVGSVPVDGFDPNPRYNLYREHIHLMEKGQVYLPYNEVVSQEFGHGSSGSSSSSSSGAATWDGVALYRRLLAQQPDSRRRDSSHRFSYRAGKPAVFRPGRAQSARR